MLTNVNYVGAGGVLGARLRVDCRLSHRELKVIKIEGARLALLDAPFHDVNISPPSYLSELISNKLMLQSSISQNKVKSQHNNNA